VRLSQEREEVPWAKVLELLVVSRGVSPGSEIRLHRQGFDQSAMGDLLGCGFAVAENQGPGGPSDRTTEAGNVVPTLEVSVVRTQRLGDF
jgi:hypothetical protein